MQFLYPIFLLAGLSLAIPLAIHLFNLRRYKTIAFPHSRFLKDLQLHSQKQSKLRYKWLLAARLFFLGCLVLAFAQPSFFNTANPKQDKGIPVIFIDNSLSMSQKTGELSLLDQAKNKGAAFIQNGNQDIILLDVDNIYRSESLSPLNAQNEIRAIQNSYKSFNLEQLILSLRNIANEHPKEQVYCYCFSDFQQSQFPKNALSKLPQNIHFDGIQIASEQNHNLYIDTAYFENPFLQNGQNNRLIVRSRAIGKTDEKAAHTIIQLLADGKIKSAVSPLFDADGYSSDTLSYEPQGDQWSRLVLVINDGRLSFDDSFLIAVKSRPELKTLQIYQQQANPYLQSALSSANGFSNKLSSGAPNENAYYNLILLDALSEWTSSYDQLIKDALDKGQNIFLSFSPHANLASINKGLSSLSDIQCPDWDTVSQQASGIQKSHPLLKDIFEELPDNLQLPYSRKHVQLLAGISANQRSIISFRNGSPLLSSFKLGAGQLFICTCPLEAAEGNFQTGHLFVPLLYQMASQSGNSNVFATRLGSPADLYIPQFSIAEQNQAHLEAKGIDIIPPQRAIGKGLKINLQTQHIPPGFYTLKNKHTDSVLIGMNTDRSESDIKTWSIEDLRKNNSSKQVSWQKPDSKEKVEKRDVEAGFPLWKLCSTLALLMLGIETFLLCKNKLKQPQTKSI